jgi:5-oxopent-3-ene-1,2,5-tricarboxylate decarboxylase/2-hydroxyhepta-2,4-diene-1,7-dioate isomerase
MLTCKRIHEIPRPPLNTLSPPGCVYGVALNYRPALESLAEVFNRPPYGKPPVAPVLYIKPRNTWRSHLDSVPLPDGIEAVEVGATVGIVFARDARCVPERDAEGVIAGYVLANDVTIPHASLFRPPLRFKCRDGFCPLGGFVARDQAPLPDALEIRVYVNGELRTSASTTSLHRNVAQLISEVTEFMTLRAQDVLLLGVPPKPALARAGDLMTVEVDGLGRLENRLLPAAEFRSEAAR